MQLLKQRLIRDLEIRGLSKDTQDTYIRAIQRFVKYFNKEPEDISLNEISDYQYYLKKELKLSFSSMNVSVAAIKFFFQTTLGKKYYKIDHIPYSKKRKKLPVILSKEEIERMYKGTDYIKHKAVISAIYSTGMRVCEISRLRINDIDSKRNMIVICNGKGQKDRYVMLSKKLLILLRQYWKEIETKPLKWIFPGVNSNKQISRKTVF